MRRSLILDASAPDWDEWIDRAPHDFYHKAAYHRFSELQGEGSAFLAVYGTENRFLAWPYLLRPIEPLSSSQPTSSKTLNDITSVYGYSGPVVHGCDPGDEFVTEATQAIQDAWRSQNAVSAFTRFHPLLESQCWLENTGMGGDVSLAGKTVSVDCTVSDEVAYRTYKRVLRQQIAAARKQGLRTEIDENWDTFDTFLRLYERTMTRNRAASYYQFSGSYFRDLKVSLGKHALLLNTTLNGRIILACIWVVYGAWVHAHLEGADEGYLRYSPFKVMIDDVRRWARDNGYLALHLGGGRGGKEDSLFEFKARFSPRHHSFHIGRFVLNELAYDGLCAEKRYEAAQMRMAFEPAGYFPAYRAALASQTAEPNAQESREKERSVAV